MFEHVVLRRSDNGNTISLGQLAEAMLYYKKVHLILDRGTLHFFVNALGLGPLLSLLNRTELTAVYCDEILGTNTESIGTSQFHNYVSFNVSGNQATGALKTPAERLEFDLRGMGIQKKDAKNFVQKFLDIVPFRKLSGNYFTQGGIVGAANSDLLDAQFVRQAAKKIIETVPGGHCLGSEFKFEILNSELGNFVFTNTNFDAINHNRSVYHPPIEPLTVAHILSNILEARADLTLASFYGGDFITSSTTSAIIQVKHSEILHRMQINTEERQQFVELILPDTPSLAEVIDKGERSFNDFLLLLDRSLRFKDWLHKINPDENLIRSYMQDISSEGWIQRLPAKSVRYMLTIALDVTNPIAGFVAGFVDNFVVEKLFNGWRPNHFVTSRLAPFVDGRQ